MLYELIHAKLHHMSVTSTEGGGGEIMNLAFYLAISE